VHQAFQKLDEDVGRHVPLGAHEPQLSLRTDGRNQIELEAGAGRFTTGVTPTGAQVVPV
jgi:hypothetical protein